MALRRVLKIFPILFGLMLSTGCGEQGETSFPANAVIPLSDAFTGKFSLVDVEGRPFSDKDLVGRIGVIYFGFASCPDVCPLSLGTLSAALSELTESERGALIPLFITVDPERDSAEVLETFLAFDPRIRALRGDEPALSAARNAFKVYAQKQPLEDSALGYTMAHSDLFYVTDRSGTPVIAIHTAVTPEQLAAILRKYIRAPLT